MKFFQILGKSISGLLTGRRRLRRHPRKEMVEAWKDSSIPRSQWQLVEQQLESFMSEGSVAEFDTFAELIELTSHSIDGRVIEVGASSGYYSQVLSRIRPSWSYYGVDFSTALIQFGQNRFPAARLMVADALDLPFSTSAFDVAVSGGILLHIHDWRRAFAETVRVAGKYVLLHRTPVSSRRTELFRKRAYGQKMIEWRFNEQEIKDEARNLGLKLIAEKYVYKDDSVSIAPTYTVQKSYLFQIGD